MSPADLPAKLLIMRNYMHEWRLEQEYLLAQFQVPRT
jgi:hypothetical protein